MHGEGEYRSRYRGDKGVFVTYEGHFYANRMHGYGTMSYPDGAVFRVSVNANTLYFYYTYYEGYLLSTSPHKTKELCWHSERCIDF